MSDIRNEQSPLRSVLKWGMLAAAAGMGSRAAFRNIPAFRRASIEVAAGVGDVYRSMRTRAATMSPLQAAGGARTGSATVDTILSWLTPRGNVGGVAPASILSGQLFSPLSEINLIQHSGHAKETLRASLISKFGPQVAEDLAIDSYRHITVGDVLQNAKRVDDNFYRIGDARHIPAKDYSNLVKAANAGVVDADFIIDRHIMTRQLEGGKLAIRDASLLNIRGTAARWTKSLQEITYMGASPFDIIPAELIEKQIAGYHPSQIPIQIRGRGRVKVGGDAAYQIGEDVYKVTGYRMQHVGKTDARIYKSGRMVSERAGQVGLAGKYVGPDKIIDPSTLAERMEMAPGRYKGTFGKVRKFLEGVGERWGIGPQYAKHPSIGGGISAMLERHMSSRIPVNLQTGATGAAAFAEKGIGAGVAGAAKVTPPSMRGKLFWATPEELQSMSLDQMKALTKAARGPQTRVMRRTAGGGFTGVGSVSMTGGEAAGAFARKILTTPLRTFEYATGLGVKPGSATQMVWGLFAKGVIPAWMGWEAIKYTDYLIEQVTGLSPIKGMAYIYAGGQTTKQAALNLTGMSAVSNAIDATTGGLWSSTAGTAMRTAAIFGAGIALGKSPAATPVMRKWAPRIGAGLAAASLATTKPGKPAGELWDEYMGKRKVPVRRGRWWMIGCFDGSQPILYASGAIKKASEVAPGDILINDAGEKTTVLVVQERETESHEKLYTIRARCIATPTLITGNHEVRVHRHPCHRKNFKSSCHPLRTGSFCSDCPRPCRSLNLSYIRADEINDTDWLVIPRRPVADDAAVFDMLSLGVDYIDKDGVLYAAYVNSRDKYQKVAKAKPVPKQFTMDRDVGKLAGWIFAEGNIHRRRTGVQLTHHTEERQWAKKMSRIAEKLFGSSYSNTNKGNTGRTCLSGRWIAEFCNTLGIVTLDSEKHINTDLMLRLGREFVIGFIQGAFYGDGTRGEKKPSIKTCSYEAAVAFRDLILAVDGLASISESGAVLHDEYFEAYRVHISKFDYQLEKHYTTIDKVKQKTKRGMVGFEDYVLVSIRDITISKAPSIVYDFCVDSRSSIMLPGHVVHNSQPWEGGEVMYYRHHLVNQVMTDAQYEKYGGKEDYFKHISLLPNLHNLFLGRTLADPYGFEKKHYWDRPYPISRGLFSSVPLAGPLLNLTAGRILKPRIMMHQPEIQAWMASPPASGDPEMQRIGEQLDIPTPMVGRPMPRYGAAQELGVAIHGFTDFIGMPGFTLSAMKEHLTGSAEWFHSGPVWQTPDYKISQARGFFEADLGGMFGTSEPIRRLIYKEPYNVNYVNPIPNQMAAWLPGGRSEFGDTGFIDFHTGDPYAKMRQGDIRLQGVDRVDAGNMNKQISPFDKWTTLAEVAPYSKATDYYGRIVGGMAANGALTNAQKKQMDEIHGRMPLYNAATAFSGEYGYANGIVSKLPVQIPWVSTKVLGARTAKDHYRNFVLYGSDFHDWKHPVEQMYNPYLAQQSMRDPVSAAAGGAMFGLMGRSPATQARLGMLGAVYGTYLSLTGPRKSEKEERREYYEDYFDKMQYMKLRMMEERADLMGRADLIGQIQMMQRSTMAGLDYGQDQEAFAKSAQRALPTKDRDYLVALAADNSVDIDELPVYMRPIVRKLRGETVDSPGRTGIDAAVSQWMFQQGGVPGGEWPGWAPGMSMDDVKAVTVASEGANLHDYGVYEPQLETTILSMPGLQPIQSIGLINGPNLSEMSRLAYNGRSGLAKAGLKNPSVTLFPTLGRARTDWSVSRDRRYDARSWRERGSW